MISLPTEILKFCKIVFRKSTLIYLEKRELLTFDFKELFIFYDNCILVIMYLINLYCVFEAVRLASRQPTLRRCKNFKPLYS